MVDNKGETTKKQSQQSHSSSSPQDPLEESPEAPQRLLLQQNQPPPPPPAAIVVTGATPFISTPLYVPLCSTSSPSPFDPHFETTTITPKRPRYATAQWKLLPSPNIATAESTPSPTAPISAPKPLPAPAPEASSSDTPPNSPIPSISAASGQDTSKSELQHHQFRKGKYVSPVWKPNEMLWLARAWRNQYQTSSDVPSDQNQNMINSGDVVIGQSSRGKTRADKDREVADFLQKHGINRDAKTAGTKWDNMLGEFRKVYEWEKGGERDQVGKSYFRLSPYERKLHRLPASFDEQVFEELSQFMGPRMRLSHGGRGSVSPVILSGDDSKLVTVISSVKALPPPHPFKEEAFSHQGRTKQLVTTSGSDQAYVSYGNRGNMLGFEASMDTCTKEIRRIGKVRMTWEESVSLWGEEGEISNSRAGRIRVLGSSFLNAEELTFFDESMVACTMESFEEGPLKGFSVDRFVSGQQVKVVGRRKSSASGFIERIQPPSSEPSIRANSPVEYQDPSEYCISCLRVPPTALPSLFELSWYLQEPPPEELRFPLRRDIFRDLPQGKDTFFTTSTEPLDSRAIFCEILSPLIRPNPTNSTSSRDSFIGLWDDCINRIITKFCSVEVVIVRKPSSPPSNHTLQDQWPNVTGFIRNLCLWRGEETDQLRESQLDPSSSIVEKVLWTFMDIPYILGYYAVGYLVTFCALSRPQDRIVRTDLYTLDLSSPVERLKALIPCYRIAGLLPLLAERCLNNMNGGTFVKQLCYSDFERVDLGNGNIIETTPNMVTRFYPSKRKFTAVKEIYDYLDQRIPHAEFIFRSQEKDLSLVFKPRGVKLKPMNFEQLVEALKYVTKALVALHDLSFMHRDLSWDKVMRRSDRENEWFVSGFEEAVGAPQIYPMGGGGEGRGRQAPEMGKGLHGVKVDIWGVGQMVRTCGIVGGGGSNSVPKMLRELQNRCLEEIPEQRPTAADCYHHLLQLQSSLQSSASASTAPY
ncbi:Protein kinase superfamily protein [Euphorbia peplus]|nr:Protein kinase superfamily protein [Euphorbia peplus]